MTDYDWQQDAWGGLYGDTVGVTAFTAGPYQPEDHTTDKRPCKVFAFVVSFVCMGLTSVFGFVGNYLSVVTLGRDRSLRTSVTKFLLTVLAVADMTFLAPVVVVIMIPAYCELPGNCSPAVHRAIKYISQYGWAVASAAHMSTVYVTVLVAVHRYIYVCRPHDTARLSGLRRAKLHVAIVPVFAFIYSLPRLLEYSISYPSTTNDSVTVQPFTTDVDHPDDVYGTLAFTEIGGSFYFQIIYKNVCFYLFMYIIPLTTLVYVTLRLITTMRMRKNSKIRSTAPMLNRRQQSRDDKVTVVLLIIIVVFIVCQTPTLVQRLLLALSGVGGLSCGHPYYYVERLADYLAVFNSCVNFVVYVVFAPHFRAILLTDVLHVRRRRRRRPICAEKPVWNSTSRSDSVTRRGTEYCSEMAECFGFSSQTGSSARDSHQLQQLQQQMEEERQCLNVTCQPTVAVAANGAAGTDAISGQMNPT